MNSQSSMLGRIDVHSHLVPGVDDGCKTLEESLACARQLVEAGYSHCVCTPHIWPNLPNNTPQNIGRWVDRLQKALDKADIPLRLIPGGEHNLQPGLMRLSKSDLMTYALAGKYLLIDLWAERLPHWFDQTVRWLQEQDLTVILAHPERMGAVQNEPELADHFAELGLLLQGNLQCLGEPPEKSVRRVGEQYLRQGRYFMLGSDLHETASLPVRLAGLANAAKMIGEEKVWQLTSTHPAKILGFS